MRERKVGTSGTNGVGLGTGRVWDVEDARRFMQAWHIGSLEGTDVVGRMRSVRSDDGVLGGIAGCSLQEQNRAGGTRRRRLL